MNVKDQRIKELARRFARQASQALAARLTQTAFIRLKTIRLGALIQAWSQKSGVVHLVSLQSIFGTIFF